MTLFKTTIRRNTDINKATSLNKTIFQFDLRVNGSKDYLSLTKEVISKITNLEGIEKLTTLTEGTNNEV